MKKLIVLLMMFWLCTSGLLPAQNASITLPNVSYCDNTTILVPATVVNFLNVGAMTLDIAFDTLACSFKSLQNINPAFNGLIYNVLHTPQTRLRVMYSNMSGANLASGVLFSIEFNYKSGQTNLQFLPTCELTTPSFQNIPVTYNSGSVSNLVTITQQPQNQTVYQPETAVFTVVASGNPAYQWQQSINNGGTWTNLSNSSTFQGVTTAQLSVYNTNNFLNGRLYRCRLTVSGCTGFSAAAMLTVLPPLANHTVDFPAGWSSFSTYIDPLNKNMTNMFSAISDRLVILISGELMYYPSQGINTIGLYDPQKGYTIKLSSAASLTVTGALQTDKTINLPAGWSHLPVIANCEVPVQMLFGANLNQVYMIKEIAGTKVFWPEMNILTLNALLPGRAYMVRMNNAVQVTYPSCN